MQDDGNDEIGDGCEKRRDDIKLGDRILFDFLRVSVVIGFWLFCGKHQKERFQSVDYRGQNIHIAHEDDPADKKEDKSRKIESITEGKHGVGLLPAQGECRQTDR